MRSTAQPVTLALCRLPSGQIHGATLSSFASVSLAPALVSFSVRRPSRLAAALDAGTPFTLNVLAAHHEALADAFAHARAQPLMHSLAPWTSDHIPHVPDALGSLACKVDRSIHLGTSPDEGSTLFLASVQEVRHNESVTQPLLYWHQKYCTLGSGHD